ncbi:MAG: peptidylprolyl isomerase [Rhodobacteraceae bacterium]|nr:peptidylprolyl isomerase [Paracoccaceae bacterium]
MQQLVKLVVAAALACAGAGVVAAQGLFAPAITVNEDVITTYELEQRTMFLRLLRAPGDASEEARKALIEDRLKQQVIESVDLKASPEQIETGMDEFAARANLGREAFIAALREGGVDAETFRDFVAVGIGWREYVRARFLGRARPTDTEIDRAMGTGGGAGGVRVLLSEIIMPTTPQTEAEVQARAERIAGITSFAAFSTEAATHSATNTRAEGGRMPWMPITQLPAQLRPLILSLAPGEVTAPIGLPNAIALFQLRDIRETATPPPTYAAIEYAIYHIPGGRSETALARAADLRARVDTCDDLYGFAQGQPPEVLERHSRAPADLPQEIALELAKLDEGEISTALSGGNGQTLLALMLCGRTAALNENASREDVATALTQRRLEALAQSYLDQLRADAVIVER